MGTENKRNRRDPVRFADPERALRNSGGRGEEEEAEGAARRTTGGRAFVQPRRVYDVGGELVGSSR